MHYAVDFETYYDDEVSIKTLGGYMYLQHPDTDIYMVSIYGPDIDYVGPPEKAPWSAIAGKLWVSHNAAFDALVFQRLLEKKVVKPQDSPSNWQCTANMSVYFAAPRDLKGAAFALLGEKLDKGMRNWMKGKRWQDAVEADKADALCDYARTDSKMCYRLWLKWADKWPEQERKLSDLTIEMAWAGVAIDLPQVEAGITHLQGLMFEADQQIPWVGQLDAKGEPIKRLSAPQLAKACREAGIPPPVSVAQDSEECEEWLEEYGKDYPWVMALRTWRRCNALCQKLKVMKLRYQPNGRMQYGLKYFGAHTGRWSGDQGWNAQNLPREPMFGVDMRSMIIPEKGKKFIIADLAQIEPRILAWLVKDQEFLDFCRKGMSPYEAHARLTMGWIGGALKKEEPNLYILAKARLLALGYGAGWLKFITMAKKYKAEACFDHEVTDLQQTMFTDWLEIVGNHDWLLRWENADEEKRRIFVNSWLIVTDFRKSNDKIVEFWGMLEEKFQNSYKDGVFDMVLPSGRHLFYRQISGKGGQWTATTERFGPRLHFYGGKLTENLVQAAARDVFAEAKLRLRGSRQKIVLSIHDEVVIECDPSVETKEIAAIIEQPVPWLPGCPIACEAFDADSYTK